MRHLALLRGVNVGGARSDANTTLPLWMTVAAAADGYAAASRDVRPTARRDFRDALAFSPRGDPAYSTGGGGPGAAAGGGCALFNAKVCPCPAGGVPGGGS
jgi:hypothetical protein